MTITRSTKKLPYPRLENPRLFRDGATWLRVFHARADLVKAPFYGVNIWRVQRKRLVPSIVNLLKLGGPGLKNGFGDPHSLTVHEDKDPSDRVTVVLIYDWHSLPAIIEGPPPVSILPAHFRFISLVDGYNWNLFKSLETDPKTYAGMLTHRFHTDICSD